MIVALGAFGWDGALRAARALEVEVPRPRPRFGHGAEARLGERWRLLGCFHPSQQNTFTGKLTVPMIDAALHPRRRAGDAGEPFHQLEGLHQSRPGPAHTPGGTETRERR